MNHIMYLVAFKLLYSMGENETKQVSCKLSIYAIWWKGVDSETLQKRVWTAFFLQLSQGKFVVHYFIDLCVSAAFCSAQFSANTFLQDVVGDSVIHSRYIMIQSAAKYGQTYIWYFRHVLILSLFQPGWNVRLPFVFTFLSATLIHSLKWRWTITYSIREVQIESMSSTNQSVAFLCMNGCATITSWYHDEVNPFIDGFLFAAISAWEEPE